MQDKILGGLEARAKLGIGSERLLLLFTEKKIILAHLTKTGRGALALYSILGRISNSLTRGKKVDFEKIARLSPETVLEMDRENFAIDYTNIVALTFHREATFARVTVLTKDSKIELEASSHALEGIRELLSSLLQEKASCNG